MSVFHTVGHSTHERDAFLALLRAHDIELLVDVRRHPGSRRNPHFDRREMAAWLTEAGIAYRHEEELGGRRGPPPADSANGAWRSQGFRAYADHLGTEVGAAALDRLERAGRRRRAAVMCAEAVPWRCHRQIVADHLVARGHEVRHILGRDRAERHELRETARVAEGGRVTYPARQTGLFDGGEGR